MAVDIARIRLYNIPEGIIDGHITEHLTTATAERTRRLETDTYTGDLTVQYDLILIYLTLARIYDVEDTFFISGIPESGMEMKQHARHFSRSELDLMIAKKEQDASENIGIILTDIAEEEEEDLSTDEVRTIGGITNIAVGGSSTARYRTSNILTKDPQRNG